MTASAETTTSPAHQGGGYRFITDELAEAGVTAGRNRVNRLCEPSRLWLTDLIEHLTGDGKLYLCAIKDAYSNRIAGYSMAERMTTQLAVDALANACSLRRPTGTVVHSDRGSQFRSHAFVRALREPPGRIDGPRRRGQRGHGVVLLAAAEERVQPSPLADT
jgi:transposase InsO family protein